MLSRALFVVLAGLAALAVWFFMATHNPARDKEPAFRRQPGSGRHAELLKTRKQILRQIEELRRARQHAGEFSRGSLRQLQDILTEVEAELRELDGGG